MNNENTDYRLEFALCTLKNPATCNNKLSLFSNPDPKGDYFTISACLNKPVELISKNLKAINTCECPYIKLVYFKIIDADIKVEEIAKTIEKAN